MRAAPRCVSFQPSTERYGNRLINDINASDSERGYGRPESSGKIPGSQAPRWSLIRSGCAGHVPEKYHAELGRRLSEAYDQTAYATAKSLAGSASLN
jgi:hypothetical protein